MRPPSLRSAITTSQPFRPASSSAAAMSFLASSKVKTGFILMLASPACPHRARIWVSERFQCNANLNSAFLAFTSGRARVLDTRLHAGNQNAARLQAEEQRWAAHRLGDQRENSAAAGERCVLAPRCPAGQPRFEQGEDDISRNSHDRDHAEAREHQRDAELR